MLENSIYNKLYNLACLWSRTQIAIIKKQKHFSLPDHQFPGNLIIAFCFCEGKKEGDKDKFVVTFVGVIVAIIFIKYFFSASQ